MSGDETDTDIVDWPRNDLGQDPKSPKFRQETSPISVLSPVSHTNQKNQGSSHSVSNSNVSSPSKGSPSKYNRSQSLDNVSQRKKQFSPKLHDCFSGSSLSSLSTSTPDELMDLSGSDLSDLSYWSNLSDSSALELDLSPKRNSSKGKSKRKKKLSKHIPSETKSLDSRPMNTILNLDLKNSPSKLSKYETQDEYSSFTPISKAETNSSMVTESGKSYEDIVKFRKKPGRRRKVDLIHPNRKDDQGRPQLLYFASRGDLESCKKLVKYGASINSKDKRGWTIFHEGSRQGNIELLSFIFSVSDATNKITKYIDINVQNISGNTPLHEAVLYKNSNSVSFLIEHGARVDIKNFSGNAPEDINKSKTIGALLDQAKRALRSAFMTNKAGQTRLHRACRQGNLEKVIKQLNSGADVNAADNAGWTPLHEASLAGYIDITRELLRRNAKVNTKGLDGDTPLHDACANGHTKVVQSLLEAGADYEMENQNAITPIQMAKDENTVKVIKNWKKANEANNESDDLNSKSRSSQTSDLLFSENSVHSLASRLQPSFAPSDNNKTSQSPTESPNSIKPDDEQSKLDSHNDSGILDKQIIDVSRKTETEKDDQHNQKEKDKIPHEETEDKRKGPRKSTFLSNETKPKPSKMLGKALSKLNIGFHSNKSSTEKNIKIPKKQKVFSNKLTPNPYSALPSETSSREERKLKSIISRLEKMEHEQSLRKRQASSEKGYNKSHKLKSPKLAKDGEKSDRVTSKHTYISKENVSTVSKTANVSGISTESSIKLRHETVESVIPKRRRGRPPKIRNIINTISNKEQLVKQDIDTSSVSSSVSENKSKSSVSVNDTIGVSAILKSSRLSDDVSDQRISCQKEENKSNGKSETVLESALIAESKSAHSGEEKSVFDKNTIKSADNLDANSGFPLGSAKEQEAQGDSGGRVQLDANTIVSNHKDQTENNDKSSFSKVQLCDDLSSLLDKRESPESEVTKAPFANKENSEHQNSSEISDNNSNRSPRASSTKSEKDIESSSSRSYQKTQARVPSRKGSNFLFVFKNEVKGNTKFVTTDIQVLLALSMLQESERTRSRFRSISSIKQELSKFQKKNKRNIESILTSKQKIKLHSVLFLKFKEHAAYRGFLEKNKFKDLFSSSSEFSKLRICFMNFENVKRIIKEAFPKAFSKLTIRILPNYVLYKGTKKVLSTSPPPENGNTDPEKTTETKTSFTIVPADVNKDVSSHTNKHLGLKTAKSYPVYDPEKFSFQDVTHAGGLLYDQSPDLRAEPTLSKSGSYILSNDPSYIQASNTGFNLYYDLIQNEDIRTTENNESPYNCFKIPDSISSLPRKYAAQIAWASTPLSLRKRFMK
ncbi:hypothetical protein BB560_003798 [Smittium megazygosporum]|uniref:Uncharacterized protein n=1 Tax=Smittium megazygosporum TaxID=133381 RepID=A0A2T9ZB17_9FUNG|nr:hypothetical protein BB560_003798 [Smittium megazygosporum]